MSARRLTLLSVVLVGVCSTVNAQSTPDSPTGRLSDPFMPNYSRSYQYRSRTAPQPTPTDPDAEYGFRNPGGVGRMKEFYPPGNTFEKGRDPVKAASFDNGPSATSRQSQFQAQMVGNARTATLNNHIDNYARPIGSGFGFGFGGFGGFPY